MQKQVTRVKKIQLLEKRGEYEIIIAGEEQHDIIIRSASPEFFKKFGQVLSDFHGKKAHLKMKKAWRAVVFKPGSILTDIALDEDGELHVTKSD
jgi:hypothetical protein